MTKFERFINRLNELGVDMVDGSDRNDPVALADGIHELLTSIERYELDYERFLLWLLISNSQMVMWKDACDQLEDINKRQKAELKQMPHVLIQKFKAAGRTPPKGIVKNSPKKFATVAPHEELAAERAGLAARNNQKAINPLNMVPSNVLTHEGTNSMWGRAIAAAKEDTKHKTLLSNTTTYNVD